MLPTATKQFEDIVDTQAAASSEEEVLHAVLTDTTSLVGVKKTHTRLGTRNREQGYGYPRNLQSVHISAAGWSYINRSRWNHALHFRWTT